MSGAARSPEPGTRDFRIAVLISGGGSTLANLIERIGDGRLPGMTIAGVVSSRPDVRGVEIARAAGLAVEVVRRRDFATDAAFSEALSAAVDRFAVDLVVLGGFLCLWLLPPRYAGCVINIHPALLPKYGGKGFFGHRVHEAVLAAGDAESGCTVHVATNEYDRGPILAQTRVPVLSGDTAETLAQRVMAAERELYPAVIARIAAAGSVAGLGAATGKFRD